MDKNEKKVAVLNPYDVLGKAHNRGLDYVIERLSSDGEIKPERVVELASQYVESIDNQCCEREHSHHDRCGKEDMKIGFVNHYVAIGNNLNLLVLNSVDELVKRQAFNEEQQCFINQIVNVSDERDLDLEGTLKILMNIEEQILASDLTPEELQVPLIMVSVAKYSVKYWMEQMKDDNSRWGDFVEGGLDKFKFPWKADALGAMTGIGGGFVGAIGGAIGGSVISALGWK